MMMSSCCEAEVATFDDRACLIGVMHVMKSKFACERSVLIEIGVEKQMRKVHLRKVVFGTSGIITAQSPGRG